MDANGGDKYQSLELQLRYGVNHIVAALTLEKAVSYRFKRDSQGWRVFITVDELPFEQVSDKRLGAIGVENKPLVVENLSFDKKKTQLEGWDGKMSRMLSSLTYSKTLAILQARRVIKRWLDGESPSRESSGKRFARRLWNRRP